MRRFRGALIFFAASGVAACATIAGLDGYSEGTDGGGGGVDSSIVAQDSATAPDTYVPRPVEKDAEYDVLVTEAGTFECVQCGPNCCLFDSGSYWCLSNNQCGVCSPLDTLCTSSMDCCSSACAGAGGGKCVAQCQTADASCDASACCLGLTCNGNGVCQ